MTGPFVHPLFHPLVRATPIALEPPSSDAEALERGKKTNKSNGAEPESIPVSLLSTEAADATETNLLAVVSDGMGHIY